MISLIPNLHNPHNNEKQSIRRISFRGGFVPAEYIKQAKKYGHKNLDIETYRGVKDLTLINYINEGLYEVKQKFKDRAELPNKILTAKKGVLGSDTIFAVLSQLKGSFIISPDFFKSLDKNIKKKIKQLSGWKMITKDNKSQRFKLHHIFQSDTSSKFEELITNFNLDPSKLSLKDKLSIIDVCSQINDTIIENKGFLKDEKGKYKIDCIDGLAYIFHEIGHNMHKRLKELQDPNSLFVKDFSSDSKKQKIAGKVSWYAKTDPNEFVAETFARLMCDKKFDDDVMQLYDYYGGVKV